VPASWVTADEVYGGNPALRGWLETRGMPFVLAVKCTEPLRSPSGPPTPAARLAERIPPQCWLRISAGWGAKGRRWYAWSRVALATADAPDGWGRWLLVRRSLTTGELAYYVCAGLASTPLVALVRTAGTRWRVEEAFQAGKGLCGLDQHQVRRWRSWYRWVTLAMLAYAFLVVAAVTEHTRHPAPPGVIELTCNEIQHLFAALVCPPAADRGHRLRWSWWRRRQQARARACHYRRQAAQQP
jgi:SRSO17 transposase